MIVLSGVLVVAAFALLGVGWHADTVAYVYASIGVSVLAFVFLLRGIVVRGEEVSAGVLHDSVSGAAGRLLRSPSEQDEAYTAPTAPPAFEPPPALEPPPAFEPEVPDEAFAAPRADPSGAALPPLVDDEAPLEDDEDLLEDEDDDEYGGFVVVVPGRPRYHLDGCRYLYGKEVEDLDVLDAREEGFTPCGVCRPDEVLAAAVEEREQEDLLGAGVPVGADAPVPPPVVARAAADAAYEDAAYEDAAYEDAAYEDAADEDDDDLEPDPPPVVVPVGRRGAGSRSVPTAAPRPAPGVTPLRPVARTGRSAPPPPAAEPAAPAARRAAAARTPRATVPPLVPPARSLPPAVPPVRSTASAARAAARATQAPPAPAASAQAPPAETPPSRRGSSRLKVAAPVATRQPVRATRSTPATPADEPSPTGTTAARARPARVPAAPPVKATSVKAAPAKVPIAKPASAKPAPAKIHAKPASAKVPPAKVPPVRAPSATTTASTPASRSSRGPAATPQSAPAKAPSRAAARAPSRAPAGRAQPVPAAATPVRRGSVLVLPDRDRFHRPECRYIRDAVGAEALTRGVALRQGYQPCGVCQP